MVAAQAPRQVQSFDARMDALNPRTAMREIPRGLISRPAATLFVAISSVVFVIAAGALSPLCLILSPVALAIVFWYSIAKRFTTYTQAILGLAMAVAPVGGWLAAGGRGGPEPWLLGLAIGLWVGGFDVLYACQDVEFDRKHGRARSRRLSACGIVRLSRVMHLVTVIVMASLWQAASLPALYLVGVAIVAALAYEQSLVSAQICRR
jgi:4-hydroxybenzoate polyprenyltransferase